MSYFSLWKKPPWILVNSLSSICCLVEEKVFKQFSHLKFLGLSVHLIAVGKKITFLLMGHFRITFSLFLKASLGAHPFNRHMKMSLICMSKKSHFHMKG